jgi:transcriptional regulator with XRE-family HTH domain
VAFQQVQKYEKGANRISASRLQQVANTLQVPVSFFFEDVVAGMCFFGEGFLVAGAEATFRFSEAGADRFSGLGTSGQFTAVGCET